MPNTKYINGLRIALALWVALGHLYQQIGAEKIIQIPLWYMLKNPSPAVDGFMLLTGFLMMYNYSKRRQQENPKAKSTKVRFWLRRLFRLYPIYFVVILIGFFTFPIINELSLAMQAVFGKESLPSFTYGADKSPGLIDLITHLTFLNGFTPQFNSSIIGPAWSLATEIQFYALFPFLFLWLKRPRQKVTMLILSALLYLLSHKLLGIWATPGTLMTFGAPSLLFQKMIYFSLGMFIAEFKLGKDKIQLVLFNLIVISMVTITYASAVICLGITILMLSEELDKYMPRAINTSIKLIKSLLSAPGSTFGANISYSFYLIHNPMIAVSFGLASYAGFTEKLSTALLTGAIFFPLTILVSYLLYQTIEKPFIKIGKRLN